MAGGGGFGTEAKVRAFQVFQLVDDFIGGDGHGFEFSSSSRCTSGVTLPPVAPWPARR